MRIDTNDKRVFAIGDIHGEHEKLLSVYHEIITKAGFHPEVDILIQLGDRCDRGKNSYKVNQWWKEMMSLYPKNIFCLMGNHDRMFLQACDLKSDLMFYNGGNKTQESYSKESKIYGRMGFGNSVRKVDHYNWTKNLPLYIESEDYFFSHAPIPLEIYRDGPVGSDFRSNEHTLTWSFNDGILIENWIDPNPVLKEYGNDGKTCVHGHLHNLYYNKQSKTYETPNPMKIGNSILIDTGSGCIQDSILCCLELPSLKYYLSNGKYGQIK